MRRDANFKERLLTKTAVVGFNKVSQEHKGAEQVADAVRVSLKIFFVLWIKVMTLKKTPKKTGPGCCHLCISDITKGHSVMQTPVLSRSPTVCLTNTLKLHTNRSRVRDASWLSAPWRRFCRKYAANSEGACRLSAALETFYPKVKLSGVD